MSSLISITFSLLKLTFSMKSVSTIYEKCIYVATSMNHDYSLENKIVMIRGKMHDTGLDMEQIHNSFWLLPNHLE